MRTVLISGGLFCSFSLLFLLYVLFEKKLDCTVLKEQTCNIYKYWSYNRNLRAGGCEMNENLMTAYEVARSLKLCNLDIYNFRLQILLKSYVENEKHEISILIGIFCIGQLASRIAVFYDLRSNSYYTKSLYIRAVGRSENPGVPVVIRWV